MTCPKCFGKVRVMDTQSDDETVYRRRVCVECGYLFYTEEFESTSAEMNFKILDNEYHVRRRLKGSSKNE